MSSQNPTTSTHSAISPQYAGNMDTYTTSMYEHTKRLMAAASIPYGTPSSVLIAAQAPSGSGSTDVESPDPVQSGSLPRLETS